MTPLPVTAPLGPAGLQGSDRAQVALVTGAAGDIGAMIVRRLLSDGWDVVAVDIDGPAMEVALDPVMRSGSEGRLIVLIVDLTVPEEVTAAAKVVRDRLGRLDAIVANAGGSRGEAVPFLDLSVGAWHAVLHRNLSSVHLTCWAFVPLMLETGGGAVVVTSSELATLALPGFSAYAAAKGGVQQLVRGMAVDLAPFGVRVNAVAPGPTLTGGTRAQFSRPEVAVSLAERIPLGRPASAEELLDAYLLLIGPGSRFMTGSTILVDGGLSAV